ncbi:uncharacterized protein EDB93DRAFT_181057 [Suillus bovinus]|uniref:uncharacterized protein n=1 Tax=Suillus bovinus TaxID=48563 RepID=UPI001B870010|nr:uncharacterized protein EDB93DRAFT_181057 [Suillus bovinus]KAG2128039.1 hypothetical protein EDB93DRAFT_181057 [Suillus bovinus]
MAVLLYTGAVSLVMMMILDKVRSQPQIFSQPGATASLALNQYTAIICDTAYLPHDATSSDEYLPGGSTRLHDSTPQGTETRATITLAGPLSYRNLRR